MDCGLSCTKILTIIIASMPVKTREVSYKQRIYIHALRFRAGWTLQKIADDQNLSVSTVWRICKGSDTPKKKKGHPLKLNTPIRQNLIQHATLNAENRRKSLLEVAMDCGITADEKTLRNAFRTEGYARRIARKKCFVKPRHKVQRLRFALAHQHWAVQGWRKTIFTDECYI